MAYEAYQARLCPQCRNFDSIVPADPTGSGPARVTWPDGQAIDVRQYRCLACGAVDIIRRDWQEAHKEDKTVPGAAAAGDGRMFVGRPTD